MDITSVLSVVGPVVSITAAAASWYWARKRMRWDAGKELGAFRADTLELLRQAMLVSNPTWRRVELRDFASSHEAWRRKLNEHAPLFPRAAYRKMLNLDALLDRMVEHVIGMPLGGLGAHESIRECDYDRDLHDMDADIFRELASYREAIGTKPNFFQ